MAHGNNYRSLPAGQAGYSRKLLDSHAHALTTITELHRLVHDGMVFNATGKVAALANAATATFLMVVPDGVYPHMNRATFNFGKGDVDIITRNNVVTSADGTPLGAIPNTNENSDNTAGLLMYSAPTITDVGDVLHTGWAIPTATGTGIHTSSGIMGISQGEEWVMKPNSKYTMSVTNNSGEEIAFSYDMLFYELTYTD